LFSNDYEIQRDGVRVAHPAWLYDDKPRTSRSAVRT